MALRNLGSFLRLSLNLKIRYYAILFSTVVSNFSFFSQCFARFAVGLVDFQIVETFGFEDENACGKLHFHFFFSLEKIELLPILKEVKPSLNRKVIKFLTFDNSFPPLLAKTRSRRSRLTTATKFSRQNDAGSHARTS